MTKTLTLNLAEPERPKLDLGDGLGAIEFRVLADFTPADVARAMRLQSAIANSRDNAAEGDESAVAAMATGIDELVALILPDLPAEVRARLNIGQLTTIIQFWNAEQQADQGNA